LLPSMCGSTFFRRPAHHGFVNFSCLTERQQTHPAIREIQELPMCSSTQPAGWPRWLVSTILVICAVFLIPHLAAAQAATNNSPDAYRPVLDRLHSITTLAEPEWRVYGDVSHPEDPNLNDASWETMKVEDKWSSGT